MLLRAKLLDIKRNSSFFLLSVFGLPFSKKEIIPRNTEQTEIFIHSVERNSACSVERKTLGVPFRAISAEDKKAQNSVPNHFLEEKFCSEPFCGR
jgi:hypothetical protein